MTHSKDLLLYGYELREELLVLWYKVPESDSYGACLGAVRYILKNKMWEKELTGRIDHNYFKSKIKPSFVTQLLLTQNIHMLNEALIE